MDALDLLFRRVVLAARAADALARPLDVGEVLEKLVPYRAARRDGLLETNDDYLHALMRLFSGERDLIYADELLQDDFKAELASPNPDLGLLRTYVNASLRLSTTAVQKVLAGDTEIDLRPPTPIATAAAVRAAAAATAEPPASERVPSSQLFDAVAAQAPKAAPPPAVTGEGGCPYCAQPLPGDRTVKYCPSCGLNLLIRRCAGCSAEIESGWKFCVTCGRSSS
ncbi:MAG: zinc ribbon domain-containing protein [Gemmatimonadaceae bacterium]